MRTKNHPCGAAIILTACLCTVCTAAGQLVFDGASGFGVQTPGGHGSRRIKVTNRNSDVQGSLREALEAKGRRIVVFEVGGIIDLNRDGIVDQADQEIVEANMGPEKLWP